MESALSSVETIVNPRARKQFGPFAILELLGAGGMSVVYKARHPGFLQPVALKVANRMVVENVDLSKRFDCEFELGKQLSHPNLVKTLAYGIEKRVPYLVMEYHSGYDLDNHIKQKGVLGEEEAIAIFGQIGDAVYFLHQQGYVHRDIKPANILIDAGGRAKLADLGMIKDSQSQEQLTRSRDTMGTLDFAAPEQHENAARADYRCDIFSLGVALYVAMTGVFPFGRVNQMATLLRKIKFEFAPLSRILVKVSPAFDQGVIRAMHPDPNMRPASVLEFIGEISGKSNGALPALEPVCPETYRPESKNRRKRTRIAKSLSGISVKQNNSDIAPIEAEMTNVSTHGLRIEANRAFSVGTILTLTFPLPEFEAPINARVCWIRQNVNGRWSMGCSFVAALSNAQLEILLGANA